MGEISWKARLVNLCQYRHSRNQKCPLTTSLNEVNKSLQWILLSLGNSPLDAISLSPGHLSMDHYVTSWTNQRPVSGAGDQWEASISLPPPVTARHSSVAPDWPRLLLVPANYSPSLQPPLCLARTPCQAQARSRSVCQQLIQAISSLEFLTSFAIRFQMEEVNQRGH